MISDNLYTPYPTIGQAWGIFAVLILAQIVCVPIMKVFDTDSGLGIFLTYTISVSIGLAFALWNKAQMINNLPPQISADRSIEVHSLIEHEPVPFWVCIMGVCTLPAIIMISGPIAQLIPVPDHFTEKLEALINADMDVFHFLTIVIAAALLEETIFRGIILDGFLRRYSPKKAILYSAFLFAFMHMNPLQFPHTILLGTFLGWLYYRTQSIWPCIFIHMVNNGIPFFLALGPKGIGAEEAAEPSIWSLLMVIPFGLLLTYTMITWLRTVLPEPPIWISDSSEQGD